MLEFRSLVVTVAVLLTACATPPQSDASRVDSGCAMQCQGNLTQCSSGFKMLPVVQQKQCNDVYDSCINACPARSASITEPGGNGVEDRLRRLNELKARGVITDQEYQDRRNDVLKNL